MKRVIVFCSLAVVALAMLDVRMRRHAPHPREPLSFCADVIEAFQKAGRPWGNQVDWAWSTYPRSAVRATGCLDELADDPPPAWLNPDVRTLIPFNLDHRK